MSDVYPKLKSTVLLYILDRKVYFQSSGFSFHVDDPNGNIEAFCHQLNGEHSFEEIKKTLIETRPGITRTKINEMLQSLDDALLIEDARCSPPAELNEYDLERWSRNFEFYNSYCSLNENKYDAQLAIKNCRVGLCGVGGLGTHILFDLAALGVYDIKAVDFDKIELSNLNRQILYTPSDIGKDKIWVAEERIKLFQPNLKTQFFHHRITGPEDLTEIMGDRDIIICVADKPKMKMVQWLNQACCELGIPFINGGLNNQQASYYSVTPRKSGCVDCWRSYVDHNDPVSSRLLDMEKQMDDECPAPLVPAPAVVGFVSVITGLMISELIRIVTNIVEPVANNRLMSIDFTTMMIEESESWELNTNCPTCSPIKTPPLNKVA